MIVKNDEQLIKACANGNEEAFDLLFKKYARPLTFFINQMLYDQNRSEDIFQDTFIKVLENAEKFNDRYKFSTWVYRIAINLCINELRKRRREQSKMVNNSPYNPDFDNYNFIESFSHDDTPFEILQKKDRTNRINEAMKSLPQSKRIAFILKFYHFLSYEEIASIMECSIGTVKSRIHYAVGKIQVLVKE